MRMRVAMMFLAVTVMASPVLAQNAIGGGVKVGVNFASISTDDDDEDEDFGTRTGLVVGAFADIGINDQMSFQPEFLYTQKGASIDFTEGTTTLNADLKLDMVQIHGDVIDAGIPTIHAFKVGDTLPDTRTEADYVLFDTGGGTGRTFDWSLLERYDRAKPFFLAGGITPDNVADAIAAAHPFAIDVASGVERAPGAKDHDKLRKLFEAIQR